MIDAADRHEITEATEPLGYYCSGLSPVYLTYERRLFIETLNDWGWYDRELEPPSWFKSGPPKDKRRPRGARR